LTPADVYISTGAAVALLVLPFAALRGRRAIYIESVSRFDGPSATGKLLSLLYPKIELYTQHATWSDRKWRHKFSLLSEYAVSRRTAAPSISRVFVTLGTIRPFSFSSLVARLQEILPSGVDVVWQLGETKAPAGLTGRVTDYLDASEMRKAADWADVVVSHSGVGSALWLLDLGKTPVLVPRRAYRGEHIDDHQIQIGRELAKRGLAIARDAQELEYADLLEAAARVVCADGRRGPQE
jgi:UDP-N-acetylglucosamine transferase subunit ALG13